jgi:uncharacterized protein involved in outer membrane biogenesis
MSETLQADKKRKPSSLGRKLSIIAASLLALLAVLYLVVTSSAFFKSFVLPRAGKALQASLTVESASISPFSQVTLRKLRIQTTGTEPVISADEAQVRYKLFSILRGNIDVQMVSLVSPVIQIVEEADGRSNLDPLLQSQKGPTAPPSSPTKPPQLAIKNVTLKNGTVRLIKKAKDGSAQTTEINHLDVTLDQLQNGQPGKLTLAAEFKLDSATSASAKTSADTLQGKVAGTFDLGLDPKLMPNTIKGNARVDLSKAEGAFKDLAGLNGTLVADMTPTEIRQIALRFERNGQGLGQILASGPLDLAKSEGRLNLAVQSIDRQVLNFVGARQGWDFGSSTLNSSNLVELSSQGALIAATGRIAGRQLSLRQNNQATPRLDLDIDYQINIDLQKKTAVLQKLSVVGREEQKDLLSAALDRPMNLSWGGAATSLPDSTFQLTLSQLNLKSWPALLGTNGPSGSLDMQLNVQAQQEGKLLTTKLTAHLKDFAALLGTNALEQADIQVEVTGGLKDFQIADVSRYQFELQQKGRSVAKASGSARYDLPKKEINLQADAEASLPEVLRQFPQPGATVSNGVAQSRLTFTQKDGKQTAVGNLEIKGLTGMCAEYRFQDFQTALDFNADIQQQLVQIQSVALAFRQGSEPAGRVELSGRYHLTNHSGQVLFKMADLNQHLLRLVLASSLGTTKLVSVSVNGSGSANYDPKGDSLVKADWNIANLVMDDSTKQIPPTPMSGQFAVDASLRAQAFDLRQLKFDLRQGNDSAGHFEVTGRGNLTNYAGQVSFKITDLNQIALRPILAPSLGQNQLISVALNGSGTASYDPKGDSSIKAELKVSNLVAEDPQKTLPKTPLSAQFQIDGSLRQQILDLRQCIVSLTPTQRAQNQIQLQGRLDLKRTNATPSQLSLKSASLDVTPYYDLFAGKAEPKPSPPTTKPAPAPKRNETGPAGKESEPAPLDLPFQQLTADIAVDQFYLRQIVITNFQTTAKINRGEVTLKPFQMALNGAKVSAQGLVNLAVPGYTYDLTFQADKVPIDPIASSFSTNSAGQYQGDLIAQAQVKGAGVTGASLQKNLSGQVSFSLTNLNLTIAGPKIRRVLEPIALVLRVPELTQTPLNWVNAKAEVGQGKIQVSQLGALSHAFLANGQGTIMIAEVLTNSTLNIPVNIALRRSLAEKSNLVPPNTSPDSPYVSLPTFATIQGTLGNPETKTDKVVISGLLLRSAGGIPQVGDKASGILKGLGGVLTGQGESPAGTNSPSGTNSTPSVKTNKPGKLNPLDLLRLIPEKKK